MGEAEKKLKELLYKLRVEHQLAVEAHRLAVARLLDDAMEKVKLRDMFEKHRKELAATAQTTEAMKLKEQLGVLSTDMTASLNLAHDLADTAEMKLRLGHLASEVQAFGEVHDRVPHKIRKGDQVVISGFILENGVFQREAYKGTEFERKTVSLIPVTNKRAIVLLVGNGEYRLLLLEPLQGEFARLGKTPRKSRMIKSINVPFDAVTQIEDPAINEATKYIENLKNLSKSAPMTYVDANNAMVRAANPIKYPKTTQATAQIHEAPAAPSDRAKGNGFASDAALADFERQAGMPIEKYNALTDAQRAVVNKRMMEGKVGTTAKPATSAPPSPTLTPPTSTAPPPAHVTREVVGSRPTPAEAAPISPEERARVQALSDDALAAELQAAQDRAAKVRAHPEVSAAVKKVQTEKVKLLLDEVLSRERVKVPHVPPDMAAVGWKRDTDGFYYKASAPGRYTEEGAKAFDAKASATAQEKTRVIQRPPPPPGYRPPPMPKNAKPLLSDQAIADLNWRAEHISPERRQAVTVELYKADAELRMSLAEGNPELFMFVSWQGKTYGVRLASAVGLAVALIGIGVPSLALQLQDATE